MQRQLEREKKARQEAENILEKKSLELYQANIVLKDLTVHLREKEEETRAILEATADGIIVFNEQGMLIDCNTAACKLFSYPRDVLLEKTITELIAPEDTTVSKPLLDILIELPESSLHEFLAMHRQGTKTPVELAIAKTLSAKGLFKVCALRDITDRKLAELYNIIQQSVTRVLVEIDSLEKAGEKISYIICNALKMEIGQLWTVNKEENDLDYVNSYYLPSEKISQFIDISKSSAFQSGIGLPGQIWKNKEATWIFDVVKDPNFLRAHWADEANLHTAFGFPILFEGKVVAIMEFLGCSFQEYNEKLLKMLTDIGDRFGIFIGRQKAQEKAKELNQQLMLSARSAGMAQVATNMLHNVGNVLNSVNISSEVLRQKIQNSELSTLQQMANLVSEFRSDFGVFVTQHPKGKHLASYIIMAADFFNSEQEEVLEEIETLAKNIQHIRDIVNMQQSLSSSLSMSEEIDIKNVIQDALKINETLVNQGSIVIHQDYSSDLMNIIADKVKLLQILVNLIRNARDSLNNCDTENKKISIIAKNSENRVQIQVQDNGLGIAPEHLSRIFSHGFTTKLTGHGFGLHSSALFAHEMGGQLTAHSSGIGQGALFSLTLPLKPKK